MQEWFYLVVLLNLVEVLMSQSVWIHIILKCFPLLDGTRCLGGPVELKLSTVGETLDILHTSLQDKDLDEGTGFFKIRVIGPSGSICSYPWHFRRRALPLHCTEWLWREANKLPSQQGRPSSANSSSVHWKSLLGFSWLSSSYRARFDGSWSFQVRHPQQQQEACTSDGKKREPQREATKLIS